jgi:hypothetical protein
MAAEVHGLAEVAWVLVASLVEAEPGRRDLHSLAAGAALLAEVWQVAARALAADFRALVLVFVLAQAAAVFQALAVRADFDPVGEEVRCRTSAAEAPVDSPV